ncbi:MAG: metallophosphoesterase [Candidatus Diapherotrites archaeon]|nr:metallophosphoesterase [Candidatus Diapherotrites archaeon]
MNEKKEILKGMRPVNLGLFFEKEKILAIADLHLGYEEMLNAQGVFLPRTNFEKIRKALDEMLKELPKLDIIVILGDLKHEFGFISQQEWKEVIEMLQFLQKHCKKIVLIKGNHDKILGPLVKWEGLKIEEEFYITKAGVLFLHGDKISASDNFQKAKTIVIGHEHPAVSLREGIKSEMFKCFLKGKFKGKNLVILPSLDLVSTGTNILREKLLSPFLKQDLGNFECWLVEDKAYYFGRLTELRYKNILTR